LCFPTISSAEELESGPSIGAMVGDLVFARPLLFAVTAVGTALYVVSLPATLLMGNAGDAGEAMVLTPAAATFTRCLGCTNKNSYSPLYDDELSFDSSDYSDENQVESELLGIYVFAGGNSSLSFGVDESNGKQFGLGYRLFDEPWFFLDFEGSYHTTDIVEDAKSGGNEHPTFNYDLTYKTDSVLLGPRVGLKLGNYVTTYLKYGKNYWELDFEREAGSPKDLSGSSNFYSIGLGINLTRRLGLSVEYSDAEYGQKIYEYDNNITSIIGNVAYTF